MPQYLPLHNVEIPHGFIGTRQLNSRGLCAVPHIIVYTNAFGQYIVDSTSIATLLETQTNISIFTFFFSNLFNIKGTATIDGYFSHVWTQMNLIRAPLYNFTPHTPYNASTLRSECWVLILGANAYEK